MNELLDPAVVDERIRRTLAVRAEDMAPGDGRPAEPAAHAPVVALDRSPRRRLGMTVALTAAAVLVVLGATVAALGSGDDPGRVVNSQQPDGGDTAPTTGQAPTTEPGPIDPLIAGYPIAEYEGAGFRVHVQFDAGVGDEEIPDTGAWEELEVGAHRGFYAALGGSSELRLVLEDGTVTFHAGAAPREEVLAAGASVRLDPATGMYAVTPPLGWMPVWLATPDDIAMAEERPSPGSEPVGIGFFTCAEAPTTKTFGVVW